MKALLILLAMCSAFAMPAQAREATPTLVADYLVSDAGDVIGPMVADDKVITCSVRHQLEAADILSEIKPHLFASIGGGSSNAQRPNGSGTMHEVGWRRPSYTAT